MAPLHKIWLFFIVVWIREIDALIMFALLGGPWFLYTGQDVVVLVCMHQFYTNFVTSDSQFRVQVVSRKYALDLTSPSQDTHAQWHSLLLWGNNDIHQLPFLFKLNLTGEELHKIAYSRMSGPRWAAAFYIHQKHTVIHILYTLNTKVLHKM